MEKTWKGTTAGVLEIAAGIFMLFAGIELSHIPILLIMFITAGVISLLGGICALTRHLKGLAVAGAIFRCFPRRLSA